MEGILQTEEPKSAAQKLEGVKETSGVPSSCDIALGGYVAHVIYSNASPDDRAYGLIINSAPDEFLIAGEGLAVTFSFRSNAGAHSLSKVPSRLSRSLPRSS